MTDQERLLNVSDDEKKCNDKAENTEGVTQTDLCSSWQDELEDLELSCQSDTCGDGMLIIAGIPSLRK